MNDVDKLRELIASSRRILITSHISPDPDAVSSVLLTGTTLMANFPDKSVTMALDEAPDKDLSFLSGYDNISFKPLLVSFAEIKPELLILVDVNTVSRCTRKGYEQLQALMESNDMKLAIIDHHEEGDKDEAAAFVNNRAPAAAQEVYITLFEKLKLQKPSGYAQTTLLGIVGDTNRFKYVNPFHRQTFAIVSDLIDAGADIESMESKLERYNAIQMQVLSNLASNMVIKDGYTYSFINDELVKQIYARNNSQKNITVGRSIFTNQFIRNIEDNYWGYDVSADLTSGPNVYSVSFRSMGDARDVSAIASKLGGGGHKASAGARFEAKNVNQAIEKIETAISGAVDED